jgi:hypothetical protein
MHKLLTLAAAAFTAGCMQDPAASGRANAPAPQTQPVAAATSLDVTVDDSFGGSGLRWDRAGAETFVRYRPVMQDGEMYICGAYSNRGGGFINDVGRQAMNRGLIIMNGEVVLRRLAFFNLVSSSNRENDLVGVATNCRNTGLRPSNEDLATVTIRIPTGRYRGS